MVEEVEEWVINTGVTIDGKTIKVEVVEEVATASRGLDMAKKEVSGATVDRTITATASNSLATNRATKALVTKIAIAVIKRRNRV